MSADTDVPGGRRLKRAAGAVAAVAVLIVAQASAASASTARPPTATQTLSTGAYTWHIATSTPESTQNGATNQPDGSGSLHGEFPIVGVDGTVQIRRWQWGAVTALSADTVTIVSDDGYVGDYLVGDGVRSTAHIDAVAVGEKVTVVGMIDAARMTDAE